MAASCEDSFSSVIAFSLKKLSLPDVTPKAEQRSAIKVIYEGRHVFVCLPTGYGKSLSHKTGLSGGGGARGKREPGTH